MKTVWDKLKKENREELEALSTEYAAFMSSHKTEREFTDGAKKMAEKAGYRNIKDVTSFKAGDKLYAINRNKNIVLFGSQAASAL